MKISLTWDGDGADLLKDNNGVSLADDINRAIICASGNGVIKHNNIRIKIEEKQTAEDKLATYGLRVEHSEAGDRKPIDFDIRDIKTDERYATIWGSHPIADVQCECEHPSYLIDYTDDDHERGRCMLCGAECDWHWEPDSGEVEDYHWVQDVRVPHEWHGDNMGGLIGELTNNKE